MTTVTAVQVSSELALGRRAVAQWGLGCASMTIRPARSSDVSALVALNEAVHSMHVAAYPGRFRKDPPRDLVADTFLRAFEAPSAYWLVAEVDKPVAFLSAEFREKSASWVAPEQRICYIGGIAVAEAFQRKGVARALLSELKVEAARRGVENIELDVWQFNEVARSIFAKLGFTPIMQRMVLSDSGDGSKPPTSPNA